MTSELTNLAADSHPTLASSPTISLNGPQPSPQDVRLPSSPPSDSDDESLPDPLPLKRYVQPDRDSSIGHKPIIHQLPMRLRSQSPSKPLTRPHTSGGLSTMPLMQRAHSSPGVDSSGRFITPGISVPRRPSSPLSSGRRRSPLRSSMDESFPVSWSGLNIEPNIPEHAELQLSDAITERDLVSFSPFASSHNTFPRSRRKPSSPLHASASAPTLYASARAVSPHTVVSGTHSPSSLTQKYYANEPYPTSSLSSASSMPSTPSSLRSRSPSISSLETIEDSPDAEEAALAEEEESKLRGDDSDSGTESRRRSMSELRASALRSNKERKRWSVCGAERRADFSLEPIEE